MSIFRSLDDLGTLFDSIEKKRREDLLQYVDGLENDLALAHIRIEELEAALDSVTETQEEPHV